MQRDITAARGLLQEALGVRDVALGHDHPLTEEVRRGLGQLEQLEEDEAFRQRVIRRHNAGRERLAQEDVAGGIPELEQSLDLNRRRFGDFHPDVVSCLLSLGGAWLDAGEPTRALPLLMETRLILRTINWTDTEPYARTLSLLACYYRKEGDLVQAEPLAREAVDRLRRLGPQGASTIPAALNELGNTLRERGQLSEAERTMAEASALMPESSQSGVERAKASENLATLAQERGDIARAKNGPETPKQHAWAVF